MTVLFEDDTGLAHVYTESGSEYVVDFHDGGCTCPDIRHNIGHDENCKHIRRARFALGLEPIPSDATEDLDIDENLGRWTDASVRLATSDGGSLEADTDTESDEDSDECACDELPDGSPCFNCYLDGAEFE
jgi:hypothetical protein